MRPTGFYNLTFQSSVVLDMSDIENQGNTSAVITAFNLLKKTEYLIWIKQCTQILK